MNYSSLECKNMMLHILTLIPQLNQPLVVHSTIDLKLLLLSVLLYMPLYSAP